MDSKEKSFVIGFVVATIIWGITMITLLVSVNNKLESLNLL